MKKRLEFKCWNCGKSYSLLREITEGEPKLSVACPFCGEDGVVDLAPFREPVDTIYKKSSSQMLAADKTVYELPEIVPTAKKHN